MHMMDNGLQNVLHKQVCIFLRRVGKNETFFGSRNYFIVGQQVGNGFIQHNHRILIKKGRGAHGYHHRVLNIFVPELYAEDARHF